MLAALNKSATLTQHWMNVPDWSGRPQLLVHGVASLDQV